MKTYLVTGGAGFIGSNFVLYMLKKYEDINYYRDLYDSWFAYKNENSDFTFEQWCERNNKKFSWISAYYYE